MTHATDEFLDLVDEHDRVIGRKKRSEIYSEHLSNFRVVNLFIKNSREELWIPRRSATKSIFPLCLDMSMGGHVESGETYEETLRRETQEELNFDIEKTGVRLLGHLSPQKNGVSCHMNVYELEMNTSPTYNPDDFVEYYWLTPEALLKRIENGEPVKSDLPKVVRILYCHTEANS